MTRIFFAALALLAAPVSAQTTVFTGAVESLSTPPACVGASHMISHNGTLLRSSTIDLDTVSGVLMKFNATLISGTCPVWEITSMSPATSTLRVCGTPAIGAPIRFRVEPSEVPGFWTLWMSNWAYMTPIDPVLGSILIGPPYQFLASGSCLGLAPFFEANIPADTALIGTNIHVQGSRLDVGVGGTWELTNPHSFMIDSMTLHYLLPNC